MTNKVANSTRLSELQEENRGDEELPDRRDLWLLSGGQRRPNSSIAACSQRNRKKGRGRSV
jgi:hypothetical protein